MPVESEAATPTTEHGTVINAGGGQLAADGFTPGANGPGGARHATRSCTAALRIVRDQIVATASGLTSRIIASRICIDGTDDAQGGAVAATLSFTSEMSLLQTARDQLQAAIDKGVGLLSEASDRDQDLGYQIITAVLPGHAARLDLRAAPTPAELTAVANETLGELQAMRLAAQHAADTDGRAPGEISHHSSLSGGSVHEDPDGEPKVSTGPEVRQQNGFELPRPATRGNLPVLRFVNTAQGRPQSQLSCRAEPTGNGQTGPGRPRFQPSEWGARGHAGQNWGQSAQGFGTTNQNQFPQVQNRQQSGRAQTSFETVRLQPPSFSGDPKDWLSFWTYFKRAVDDQHIPGFEKQLHLLKCLREGSPARKAVEVYAPSDANYPIVVRLLHERFGDTQNLQRSLRAHLLHLAPAKDNTTSLTTVLDEFERALCQLEQLGANVDDDSFGPLLESKLPVRVLTQLRMEERIFGKMWSVREFRTAVAAFVRCQRSAETALAVMRPDERKEEVKGDKGPYLPGNRSVNRREPPVHRVFQVAETPPTRHPPLPNRRQPGCSFCGLNDHLPSICPSYSTGQKRRTRAAEQKRCFICLAEGHAAPACARVKNCRFCGKANHHSLLCTDQNKGQGNRPSPSGQPGGLGHAARRPVPLTGGNAAVLVTREPTQGQSAPPDKPPREGAMETGGQEAEAVRCTFTTQSAPKTPAYLMIGTVIVASAGGGQVEASLIFDSGSHDDYVAASLVRRAGLHRLGPDRLRIQTFGGHKIDRQSSAYQLRLRRSDGDWEKIPATEVDQISSALSTLRGPDRGPPAPGLPLIECTAEPEILIGTRRFWDLIRAFRKSESGAYLIETVFGTVAAGENFQISASDHQSRLPPVLAVLPGSASNREELPPANAVELFWSLETIGITDDPAKDDDDEAVLQLERSIHQQPDGRYSIRLPWRETHPPLPSNFQLAYRRLTSALRRLQSMPEVMEQYQAVLDDQLQNEIIEPASAGTGRREHFIPHQAVITPKKLRVVYDASAHGKGTPSLNDCLLRGPVWLPDLAGLLLRFRACRVPVVADVEKAFLMVALEPEDREVCKFLWAKNPAQPLTTENLAIFRFRRLAFGLTSSPFCLAAVIRHHLSKHDSQLARQLVDNTYVDDVLLPAETPDEALKMAREAKQIFTGAQMNLRAFCSASSEVNAALPPTDFLGKTATKVLGLNWDAERDTLTVPVPGRTNDAGFTRRSVLGTIAGVFDPLGLIGPALLAAKRFFQQLWDETHHWDQVIEPEQGKVWLGIIGAWAGREIIIPRLSLAPDWTRLQLHVFTDASEAAFAACVYVRSEGPREAQSRLVFAKSRLKPKKAASTLTIPRMELLGILLGVRVAAFVRTQFHRQFTEEHLWSDSRIALAWVASKTPQPQFIANRLREIRSHPTLTFHFVRTDQNPSDLATRGAVPEVLQGSAMWWEGPNWLTQPSGKWPAEHEFRLDSREATEEAPADGSNPDPVVFAVATAPRESSVVDWARMPSWLRAKRVCARMFRFARRCQNRQIGENQPPACPGFSANELREAGNALIRSEQTQLSPSPNLRIGMDAEGIHRLLSRIGQSEEPGEVIEPILLPKGSRLASLIIQDIHARQLHHSGTESTLNHFLREFWMPASRQTVRRTLNQCRRCRRMQSPKFALPMMPPLPADRVRRHLPFETVGLDYLGPTLALDERGARKKTWVVLITCLSVRAVYLEATRDLSAVSFVNVLRRFIARRGCPTRVLSDNAPHFVVTGKALTAFGVSEASTAFSEVAEVRGIQWRFTPQHSPWAGGIFERMVQLCKRCMQKTFGRAVLPYDVLITALAEVEASLNLRPLTYVTDDAGAPRPLRPIDFIQENTHVHVAPERLPEQVGIRDPSHFQLAKRWHETTERIEHFWQRWTREYLMALRERAGWHHRRPRVTTARPPATGDVVLIEEAFQPRNVWPIGRIIAINGYGPEIRSVRIQMPNGRIWVRPINKICPLEVAPVPEPRPAQPDEAEQKRAVTPPPAQNLEVAHGGGPPEAEGPGVAEARDGPPIQPPAPVPDTPEGPAVEAGPIALFRTPAETRRLRQSTHAQRNAGRWASLALVALVLPLTFALATDAPACILRCAERGLTIQIPSQVHKLELCCADGCWVGSPREAEVAYELPSEILINAHNCTGHCWTNSTAVRETQIRCPAKAECQLIDCWLCVAQLANPSCNPRWTALLLGFIVSAILLCLGCCWSTMKRLHLGLSLVWRLLSFLASWPLRVWSSVTGRVIRGPTAAQLEARAKAGAKRVRFELQHARQQIQTARQARRTARTAYQAEQVGMFLAIVAILAANLAEGAEPISISTRTESCRKGRDGLTCTLNTATTITLLPFGQTVALLIKDGNGALLGTLNLQMEALMMICLPKTEGWHRSYQIETLAVKRCPGAGSCRNNFCAGVRSNTSVAELERLAPLPGHSFCLDSSSFWANDCFYASAACLFFRWAARPSSPTAYEEFSCPGWDLQVEAKARLEINGGGGQMEELLLHPGIQKRWGNITLTLLGTSLPPAPMLSAHFITNGRSVAMGKPIRTDLHCPDQSASLAFNCSLSPGACINCAPDHASGTVTCHCRDLDLEGRIEDPSARLPLTTARMLIRNHGPSVRALFSYAPVQVHVQFDGLQLVAELQEALCTVEPHNLTGCYRCAAGAQLRARCLADRGEVLADITCGGGTNFVMRCAENFTEQSVTLPLDEAEIDELCVVRCPAGETSFVLEGQLAYIPLREQFGFRQRTAPKLEPMGGIGWGMPDLGFGPWGLLGLIGSWQGALIFGGALVAGGVALWLVVRLNPAFRAYRLLLGTSGPLLVLALMAHFPPANGRGVGHLGSAPAPPFPKNRPEFRPISTPILSAPEGGGWPGFVAIWGALGLVAGASVHLLIRLLRLAALLRRRDRNRAAPPPRPPPAGRGKITLPFVLISLLCLPARVCHPASRPAPETETPPDSLLGFHRLLFVYLALLHIAILGFFLSPRWRINPPSPHLPILLFLFFTFSLGENGMGTTPPPIRNFSRQKEGVGTDFDPRTPSGPNNANGPCTNFSEADYPWAEGSPEAREQQRSGGDRAQTFCPNFHFAPPGNGKSLIGAAIVGSPAPTGRRIWPPPDDASGRGSRESAGEGGLEEARQFPNPHLHPHPLGALPWAAIHRRRIREAVIGHGEGGLVAGGGAGRLCQHTFPRGEATHSPTSTSPTIILHQLSFVLRPPPPLFAKKFAPIFREILMSFPTGFANGGFGDAPDSRRPARPPESRALWPPAPDQSGTLATVHNPARRVRFSGGEEVGHHPIPPLRAFDNGGFGQRDGPVSAGSSFGRLESPAPPDPPRFSTNRRSRFDLPRRQHVQGPVGPARGAERPAMGYRPPDGAGRVRSATPPAVRLRRSRPEHEQAVDRYVELILGPNWPSDSWKRAELEVHFGELDDGGWLFRHVRTGWFFPPSAVLGVQPANEQEIWPGMTVADFHGLRGRPLKWANWPCIYHPRGVIGSSRRSQSRQRRTGREPWRAGDDHGDWHCFESLRFAQPGTNNDNAEDEETLGAPGPFFHQPAVPKLEANHPPWLQPLFAAPSRVVPPRPLPGPRRQAQALCLSSPNRTPIGTDRRMGSGPNDDQRGAFGPAAPPRDHTVGRGASGGWAGAQRQGGPVPRGSAAGTRPDDGGGVRGPGALWIVHQPKARPPAEGHGGEDFAVAFAALTISPTPPAPPQPPEVDGREPELSTNPPPVPRAHQRSRRSISLPNFPSYLSELRAIPDFPEFLTVREDSTTDTASAISDGMPRHGPLPAYRHADPTRLRRATRLHAADAIAAAFARNISLLRAAPAGTALPLVEQRVATLGARLAAKWRHLPFSYQRELFGRHPELGGLNLAVPPPPAGPPARPPSIGPQAQPLVRSVVVTTPNFRPVAIERRAEDDDAARELAELEEEDWELDEAACSQPGTSQMPPVLEDLTLREAERYVCIDEDDDWESCAGSPTPPASTSGAGGNVAK